MTDIAENPAAKKALMDANVIEVLLKDAARQGAICSYNEILAQLGISVTKPKLRSLGKILDNIDLRAKITGEPELACIAVREEDRLPGQGWWASRLDFVGEFESHAARKYLKEVQKLAFDYWKAC